MNSLKQVKRLIIVSTLVMLGNSCKEVETVDPIPQWLQEKIEVYNGSCVYYGASATRYIWEEQYVYFFEVPVSSCVYCDIYNQNGEHVVWSDSTSLDSFLVQRTNAVILWHYDNPDCLMD